MRIVAATCVALLTCVLSGCGPKKIAWTEDVLLPDGRTIAIERMERVLDRYSSSGDIGLVQREAVSLRFEHELAALPEWRVLLIPMVLYQDPGNRQWVLVAHTNDCRVWEQRGKPKPPYWEFRVDEHNSWQQVALSPASIGLKRNLIPSGAVAGRKHISVEDGRAATAQGNRLRQEVRGNPKEFICGESAGPDH